VRCSTSEDSKGHELFLAHLDRAIAGIDEPGIGFYLPEIYRLRGECLLTLSRDNKDEARSDFVTARDIARPGRGHPGTPRRGFAFSGR
jgi:hypothetical protein